MVEWLRDFGGILAAIIGVLVSLVAAWVKRISDRVGAAHDRMGMADTRLAVLEKQAELVPDLLVEIKNEIAGMRQDGRDRQQSLYKQIEKVRLELKNDLKAKADKP